MRGKGEVSRKRKGFTGLEAAIVLTAFVVVAAVFSYVVLNAGFFTTQKSKEVVHTGVEQATSSIELAGDVIGYNGTGDNASKLTKVTFYLRLTAGHNPIDLNRTVLAFSNDRVHIGNITFNASLQVPDENRKETSNNDGEWFYNMTHAGGDNMIDAGEIVQVDVLIPYANGDGYVNPNEYFTIEVKPPQGATLSIQRKAPPSIDSVMDLT